MTDVRDLHAKWMENPSYSAEYEAMRPEFELAAAIIDTLSKVGLTQEEVAELMDVSQSPIACLESGTQNTMLKTLERFARATGTRMRIVFEPLPEARSDAL
jgi:transcriptional regulator with XRE-family HTH domain